VSGRTVWKFILNVRDAASWVIHAPAAARVVAVRALNPNDIDVWLELDPAAPLDVIRLHVVGTGQPVPEAATHVGTAFADPFIWHIYRLPGVVS
jgi:hypothetical protein